MAGYSHVPGWEGFAETVGEVYDDLGSRVDPSPVLPREWKREWPKATFLLWRSAKALLVLGVATEELPIRPYPSNALRIVLDEHNPYSSVLHLAAHALCGGLEVSRHGNYHNKLYRQAVGLIGEGYHVAFHPSVGWAVPKLTEDHLATTGHLLLATAYREAAYYRPVEPVLRRNVRIRLTCGCGRSIYTSAPELHRGGIMCTRCSHMFKVPMEEARVRVRGIASLPRGRWSRN